MRYAYALMFNKRILLLIVGIVVAIAICFSTSLFGMRTAYFSGNPVHLKPHSNLVLVVDGDINRNAVIQKF
jgi:hypothetical protein